MNFIRFGIDLGTTNSLVAKFEGGAVQVFKNPIGHKETLPSVVAFRGERILVGDKAREYTGKDAANVFGAFKRKMGSDERFPVPATGATVTPIQLSALVLKELKNFVHTGEAMDAAVITIPASFDTVQSNATKKAGYEAGFAEVLLLQEPIAAALAYFNEGRQTIPDKGHWLVYDLGGGTFDVALVSVVNGELRVTDHEGNNFLGGVDFDRALIEEIVVPELVRRTGDEAIGEKLRNRHGELEKLFYVLLHKAEEAKKELSQRTEADIELTLPGTDEELVVTVDRDRFNRLLQSPVAGTVALIRQMLERNRLAPADISRIIMVGGSTLIPYVRETVAAETGIALAFDADPTTAVAVGAAYYAGSKLRNTAPVDQSTSSTAAAVPEPAHRVKAVFQSVSSEEEELYMAVPEAGDFSGVWYRITRDDGGYDSGTKKVDGRIAEFLPLQRGCLNRFTVRFFDEQARPVPVAHPPVDIMQGKFNVAGQPLPADICLEVDDPENNSTRLQVVFERGDILPLKKTVYKEVSRTVKKGSPGEVVINVLEGTRHGRPHSSLVIGAIEIRGEALATDLLKGSDVEIRLEMDESRSLSISAYLAMSEQSFTNVFNPSEKHVSVARLRDEVNSLVREMRRELQDERARDEANEWTEELRQCVAEAEKLQQRLLRLREEDLTDEKHAIAEARRRVSARYDALGRDQRVFALQADYFNHKLFVEESLPDLEFDRDKVMNDFDRVVADEAQFLKAKSPAVLRAKIDALEMLRRRVYANSRHHIVNLFLHFASLPLSEYQKPAIAAALVKQGEQALAAEQYAALRTAMINLSHQLHDDELSFEKVKIKGTGIG